VKGSLLWTLGGASLGGAAVTARGSPKDGLRSLREDQDAGSVHPNSSAARPSLSRAVGWIDGPSPSEPTETAA